MDIWVGVLTAISVICLAMWLIGIRAARSRALDLAMGTSGSEEEDEARLSAGWLRRLERMAMRLAGQEALSAAAERLRWAGLRMRAEEFYALKLGAALVAGGMALSMSFIGLGPGGLGLALAAAAVAYLAPGLWLGSRVRARQQEVEQQLLGFVDMLAVSCEAGLNVGDALQYVAQRMGGVLGGEVGRAGDEMRLGSARARALLAVAGRLGHSGLTRLCQEVVQAEKTGTPVVEILRRQAALIREERRLQAQELAQKATVKLMAPVILLVFLPTMVLIMSPAVVNVLRVLR